VDGRFAIGEGGIALLAAIDADGSLACAARRVGWSYRHAWGYVRRAEQVLNVVLLSTRNGKGSARGTTLTPVARTLMRRLSRYRRRTQSS
jgi:molybdate transport system regulatory protein